MNREEIERLISDGIVEYVKIGMPDVEGVYRGKRLAAPYFLEALDGGFGQSDVIFGWDIAENIVPQLAFRNSACCESVRLLGYHVPCYGETSSFLAEE